MFSYLTHLECTGCGHVLDADQLIGLCPRCGKVLFARYDLTAAGGVKDTDLVSASLPEIDLSHLVLS